MQEFITAEETATHDFQPFQAVPYTPEKDIPHLTLVTPLATHMRLKLEQLANKLGTLDPSLLLNNLTHLTLLPYIEHALPFDDVKEAFTPLPIKLYAQGLHLRKPGIYVGIYSEDDKLYELRQNIAAKFGMPMDNISINHLGWVTLARYTREPNRAIVTEVLNNIRLNIGDLEVGSAQLLKVSNKQHDRVEALWSYPK